jgi:hypothetical protein
VGKGIKEFRKEAGTENKPTTVKTEQPIEHTVESQ